MISGCGRIIEIGVYSIGIYQAAIVIKSKVNKECWTQKAIEWFDGLESAAKLQTPNPYARIET
jgi:hypothetical protein